MNTVLQGNTYFQADQGSGYWQTISTASYIESQIVSGKLQQMKRIYPRWRLRAVTDDGKLIDII